MSDDNELARLRARVATLEAAKASRSKPKGGAGRWLLYGVGGLIVLGGIGSLVPHQPASPSAAASVSRTVDRADTPATTGNLVNDKLLTRSSTEQARTLGLAIGEGCRGKRAFYMGTGVSGMAKGGSFWSVQCGDGRRFAVELSPDDKDNKVLECPVFEAVGAGKCFHKIAGTV